jgi:hypothetical protein
MDLITVFTDASMFVFSRLLCFVGIILIFVGVISKEKEFEKTSFWLMAIAFLIASAVLELLTI